MCWLMVRLPGAWFTMLVSRSARSYPNVALVPLGSVVPVSRLAGS